MKFSEILLPLAIVAIVSPSARAASRADLQADYAQVRKIALKDRGVRAAYAKADAKLNAKILEIDPSLKPVVEKENAAPTRKVTQSPAKKPLQGAPARSASSYVVAKGDTLTSIAARYRVSADDLKSANGIVDERKLQVGQRLTIPARANVAKPDDSLWSRLRGGR